MQQVKIEITAKAAAVATATLKLPATIIKLTATAKWQTHPTTIINGIPHRKNDNTIKNKTLSIRW